MKKNYGINRNEEVKLASPWLIYYRKLCALFERDPEIRMSFDESTYEIKMVVDNTDKADALTKLLPFEKEFGNVTVTISIIPPNHDDCRYIDLIRDAFNGNEAVGSIVETEVFGTPISYVLFDRVVVQYPNDDIGDYFGEASTLYQDLAKELLGKGEGVHFCTDIFTNPRSRMHYARPEEQF